MWKRFHVVTSSWCPSCFISMKRCRIGLSIKVCLNQLTRSWWRHKMETFPRYWPFVRGIHRSPVNSQHKGQWRGALMFSLICARINGWANNCEVGDLRRHRAHYDVTVMVLVIVDPRRFILGSGSSYLIIPSASTKLKGGYTGFTMSVCPSVRLWTESCPLCIFKNTHRIHFIFAHLIKQLQKVCRVYCLFQNSKIWNFQRIL